MNDEELERRLCRAEQRAKSNTHRLDAVEKRQDHIGELVTNMTLIAQRQDSMEKDVGEVKEDVKTLIRQPAKRWEMVTEKIILTVVGILVGCLATRLGWQ